MSHPNHFRASDILNAVKESVSSRGLQLHQIVAAAHPETQTKGLAAQAEPSRQALERKINDLLSE